MRCRYSTTCPRRGMTLIEVVAGLALLGTMLVAIFVIHARLIRQTALAHRKAAAVQATDALLTKWSVDWSTLPIGTEEPLDDHPQMSWSVIEVANPEVEALGAKAVELRVTDSQADTDGSPLVTVQLVIPVESEKNEENAPEGEKEEEPDTNAPPGEPIDA